MRSTDVTSLRKFKRSCRACSEQVVHLRCLVPQLWLPHAATPGTGTGAHVSCLQTQCPPSPALDRWARRLFGLSIADLAWPSRRAGLYVCMPAWYACLESQFFSLFTSMFCSVLFLLFCLQSWHCDWWMGKLLENFGLCFTLFSVSHWRMSKFCNFIE